jgi:glycosyltransferase involved in cell wall biosynthesis
MAAHWLVARRRAADLPWAIYDAHNAEHILQARAAAVERGRAVRWPAALYAHTQARKLRCYERIVRLACDLTLAVSAPDRDALVALAPEKPVAIVPNGVDAASYRPIPLRAATEVAAGPRLLFFGTLDYRPNVDAARWLVREIWPAICQSFPHAELAIVGARPTAAVRALSRRAGVVVHGDVPDVRPHLAVADIVVVPLRFGAGSRLKVLEALAAGRPVVSTPLGCEGLAVRDGCHVLLAADAPGFVAALDRLCRGERLRAALARAGRQLVEERYDWSRITPQLLALYAQRSRAAASS